MHNQNIVLVFMNWVLMCYGQSVELSQGVLRGRSVNVLGKNVFTFQGIPYASAPTGDRRFLPPENHSGWEGTYFADKFKSPCPQPSGSSSVRRTMSEDCLYLNVWTTILPNGPLDERSLPVVIFFEGQLFTLGNPADIPAEDFVSSQDVVMVSVGYRLNAFGFLTLQDKNLPGNVGLRDQKMAIEWVYENIEAFGGDKEAITLMGHSSGSSSIFMHLFNIQANLPIKRVLAMSGSVLAPWSIQPDPQSNGLRLAKELGCLESQSIQIRACLQSKTMFQIVSVVDDMIRDGNVSAIFAPTIDNFLLEDPDADLSTEIDPSKQLRAMLPKSPKIMIQEGSIKNVPVMTGLVPDEGVLMAYFLKENIDKMSGQSLRLYTTNTVIASVITQQYLNNEDLMTIPQPILSETIFYQYFQPEVTDASRKPEFYDQIVNLFNGVYFAAPLIEQMNLFEEAGLPVFFYFNSYQSRNFQDIFGNQLNRRDTSHGVDLLYLFGPTMFKKFFPRLPNFDPDRQQFPSLNEERLARNLKGLFGQFIAMGKPTDAFQWQSYQRESKNYFDVFRNQPFQEFDDGKASSFWGQHLPLLSNLTKDYIQTDHVEFAGLECSTYITFTWLLLAAVLVLILVFLGLLCLVRRNSNDFDEGVNFEPSHSVFSVSNRSMNLPPPTNRQPKFGHNNPNFTFNESSNFGSFSPQQNTANRRRWRESITDERL